MGGLNGIYDGSEWEKKAALVIEELAAFLKKAPAAAPFPLKPPGQLKELAKKGLAGSDFSQSVKTILDEARVLHSPHYMGHQVSSPFPVAGLGQLLVKTINQANAIYEMNPFSVAVEKVILENLVEKLGWHPIKAGGIITNGGSVGNLTALTTARNAHFPHFWKTGAMGLSRKPAIVTSADSHYSISRAAGVLGIGADHVFKAPLDNKRRLDTTTLERFILQKRDEGFDVFAVVATSGSTPVGSFDELDQISQITEKLGMWLHVDAAHGGSVAFSSQYRSLIKGIEHADSVVWDAHKMMGMPALLTFVLYRDVQQSYRTFQQDAPYLLDTEDLHKREFDNGIRTLECTKSAEVLSLWLIWATYGEKTFSDYLEACFKATYDFYERMSDSHDFEVTLAPEANILCFRHLPEEFKNQPLPDVNAIQKKIRETLVREGKFYITNTTYDGVYYLRVTLMNPLVEKKHLLGLMEEIRLVHEKNNPPLP